ncbi:hypothetical protein NDU88_004659 [Pleurodeles waltl]|uniref:Uncharacterized protein n=1 Tax=Pleurodeles waltl TaxID=8319 RepID=A0AAV7QIX2_PLEWA|nr:hypothetical protein NDU88_004659 [Pleurodeles waltl]
MLATADGAADSCPGLSVTPFSKRKDCDQGRPLAHASWSHAQLPTFRGAPGTVRMQVISQSASDLANWLQRKGRARFSSCV